ncbi:MAG TPA: M20/M25/M40 family metallo-hydrolase, partial [Microbacteriaceae bacterium]|nr:M20/M25/M40 family metallo-hydrolase [Microbacteriaceae bacterium]
MTSENPQHAERVTRVHELTVERFPATVAELAKLVKIPSVSWDAFDAAHVASSAEEIAELARATEFFDSVRIERAEVSPGVLGQPAVLAHRAAKPGHKHVVLYAHHDVQPPGDPELWLSAAFEPTLRDDRMYGRGASDDKGGIVTHLAAIRAVQKLASTEFPLGVTLFVEGEEEAGSRSFEQFLHDHADALGGDVIVVCDSDNVDTEQPALTVALRGNVTFRLTLRTLEHANHSGMFGGAVPDAVMALIRLVDSVWTEDGSVAIAGLHSAELAGIPYDETQLRHETGLIAQPIGSGSLTDRMWAQPSVTVTGIDVPSVAEASNTLIPAVSARISVRVAPGQTPEAAWESVRAHLLSHAPWGSEVSFDEIDLGSPFLVDPSGAAFAAMERALEEGWGAAPARIG